LFSEHSSRREAVQPPTPVDVGEDSAGRSSPVEEDSRAAVLGAGDLVEEDSPAGVEVSAEAALQEAGKTE